MLREAQRPAKRRVRAPLVLGGTAKYQIYTRRLISGSKCVGSLAIVTLEARPQFWRYGV